MPRYSFSNATLSINSEIVGSAVCDQTEGLERKDCHLFKPVTVRLRAIQSYIPDNLGELVKESGVGPRNRWGGLK